jgi:AraC-like DNA-binding protein
MQNALFSARQLDLLADPSRWRLVATGLPGEAAPARPGPHDAWARRHVDAHPHREVLFVLAGRGRYGLRDATYATAPGTVFLFDAMEPHDLRYPPDHPPAEHLWFYFTGSRCGVSLMRVGGGASRGGCRTQWQRSFLLSELGLSSAEALFPRRASPAPQPALRRRCAAALALLAGALVEKGYEPQPPGRASGVQADVVQAVVRHIRESRGHGCQLENLARIAGYSKYHFVRLFRAQTGMSVRRCVDESRAQAFRELSASGAPLKVIAHRLGFAHPPALCRWKKRQGL